MLSHFLEKYIYYYQLLQVISFYFLNFFEPLILEIFIFAPKKTPGKHKFLNVHNP